VKKIVLVASAIVVLSGLVFAGMFFLRGKEQKNSPWEIETVTRKNIGSSILATGTIKPVIGAEVKVGARISGKVEHLYANIGDEVKKNQIIAGIEKKDLEAQVAQAKATVSVAEAKLQAIGNQRPDAIGIAKSNVQGATSQLYPQVSGLLSSSHGVTIAGAYNNLQSSALSGGVQVSVPLYSGINYANIKKTKGDLALTETTYDDNAMIVQSELEQAKAAYEYAKVQLSYATIKAPISGVISSVTTQEGETVAAGLNAPTFVTIIDLSRLQVDAFVDETDIGRVKIGQKATFTVDTYPDKEFTGKVAAIYPKAIIQENVVNFDVVIKVDDPNINLLRPDMTTSATIYQEEKKGVMVIPRVAVIKEGNVKFVFVKESSGAFEKKEIKTGIQSGKDIEVISGLKEGDVIGIKRDQEGGNR
jgi:RND family efflux transporter MFP subunit